MSVTRTLLPRIRESKFRGPPTSSKLSRASLSPSETFRIVSEGTRFRPEQVLSGLGSMVGVANPSSAALDTLAANAANASHAFYPPQLVELFSGFSKISYSHPTHLFSLFTARQSDILAEASPKRIVLLLESFAQLHFPLFHESVWPEFRMQLVRVIPQLKRGIPSVVESLAKLGCTDMELVEGLLVQSECLFLANEIEQSYHVRVIEAVSRIDGTGEIVKEAVRVFVEAKGGVCVSQLQREFLRAATLRAGAELPEVGGGDRGNESSFEAARRYALMARLGVSASPEEESLLEEFLESVSRDPAFSKFLPFSLFNAACLASSEVVKHVIADLIDKDGARKYSAEKLLALLRAAELVHLDAARVGHVRDLLFPIARQLTFRQSRYLSEIFPGVVPVHPLPSLLRRGAEAGDVNETSLSSCGYSLLDSGNVALEYVVPSYQVFRPGTSEMRPDFGLRLKGIQRAAGDREVSVVTDFSPIV